MTDYTTMTSEDLVSMKQSLDHDYYNLGSSTVFDDDYDKLVDELKRRGGHCAVKALSSCGAPISRNTTPAVLPVWMGSANKIGPTDGHVLEKWAITYGAMYVIEDKLDGVSALLHVSHTKISLYTRGDGHTGSDISHLLNFIKLPESVVIGDSIIVRGELVVERNTFKMKHATTFSTARNFVTGRISSKTDFEGISDIKFVAFEIINSQDPKPKPSIQLNILEKLGFEVPYWYVFSSVKNTILLSEALSRRRKDSLYDIDGLIVQADKQYSRNTKGNPTYMYAYKDTSKDNITEVTVANVEWSISKWGTIKPCIVLTKPTLLGGVNVSRATAFNAKYVVDNELGTGSRIQLTRSGDVIPYIYGVLSSSSSGEPQLPLDIDYKWNASGVDIVVKSLSNEPNIKLISYFFEKLKIKFINDATVSKFVDHGIDTIPKILSASKTDFEGVEGIKDKGAERIFNNIQDRLSQPVSLSLLLGALSVFGQGFGQRKIEVLLEAFPLLMENTQVITVNDICGIKGFNSVSAEKVVSMLKTAREVYHDIKCLIRAHPYISTNMANSATQKKYVFSGFRDDALESWLINKGHKVTDTVTKLTTAVIVKELPVTTETGKVKTARQFSVPVISVKELKSKLET